MDRQHLPLLLRTLLPAAPARPADPAPEAALRWMSIGSPCAHAGQSCGRRSTSPAVPRRDAAAVCRVVERGGCRLVGEPYRNCRRRGRREGRRAGEEVSDELAPPANVKSAPPTALAEVRAWLGLPHCRNLVHRGADRATLAARRVGPGSGRGRQGLPRRRGRLSHLCGSAVGWGGTGGVVGGAGERSRLTRGREEGGQETRKQARRCCSSPLRSPLLPLLSDSAPARSPRPPPRSSCSAGHHAQLSSLQSPSPFSARLPSPSPVLTSRGPTARSLSPRRLSLLLLLAGHGLELSLLDPPLSTEAVPHSLEDLLTHDELESEQPRTAAPSLAPCGAPHVLE